LPATTPLRKPAAEIPEKLMLKILVPVDGSESSARAVGHLVKIVAWYKDPPEIHLLNVQHPLSGDVGRFLDSGQVRDFHREEGMKALESARTLLDGAGIAYVIHIGVGTAAGIITQYAREKQCDQIVMGCRGYGSFASLFMGSVATEVIRNSEAPVLVVK
jgi:nucleotide-binding universal stress UspA family protein